MADDDKGDFYQSLRTKISEWLRTEAGANSQWAEYLLAAPDLFHLLCKLALDENVPVRQKAKLAGAIAYFVSPIDLVPEALVGPIGYVDDVAVAAYVLNALINETSEDLVRRHWAGDAEPLRLVQDILRFADEMIGSGLWTRLQSRF